jgi:hypothetical protein
MPILKTFTLFSAIFLANCSQMGTQPNRDVRYKRSDFIGIWRDDTLSQYRYKSYVFTDTSCIYEELYSSSPQHQLPSGISSMIYHEWYNISDSLYLGNIFGNHDTVYEFKFKIEFESDDILLMFIDSINRSSIYASVNVWKKYFKIK